MKRVYRFSSRLLASLFLASSVFLLNIVPVSARMGADAFPNLPLVNQDGKVMRFYDDVIKGKVVAINFMFTSCEDSCPLETAKLRHVKQLLGEHVGKDVHMYSISVDPEVDTPEVLKAYMKKFKVGPNWDFLTGKKADIDFIRKKMGMYTTTNGVEEELSDHAITFMLGNETTGQWLKRTPFDLPETLVSVLLGRLQTRPIKAAALSSYAQSRITKAALGARTGEELFASRCASCHNIGTGDSSLGPDLLGVASKRDQEWLSRWIREPDVLLKNKDPLALALFAQYNNVVMPNLQLTEEQTTAVILYMQETTRRIMKARSVKPVDHSAHHKDHGADHHADHSQHGQGHDGHNSSDHTDAHAH